MDSLSPSQSSDPQSKAEACAYAGWPAVAISNGLLDLFIVPEIGGRVIQLRLGSHEYFYVNPRHRGRQYSPEENCREAGWKNYGGSKVWPAPQGWSSDSEWPGPPDPVLDGGKYTWKIVGRGPGTASVALESPYDEYTGLNLTREITVFQGSSVVRTRHVMRNNSLRPTRWGIWQVTQQAADAGTSVIVPARSGHQMLGDKPYEAIHVDRQRGQWRLQYVNRVAKFGVIPEAPWIVTLHRSARAALVETFPLFPGQPYPDNAPVEVWINGQGTFTIHDDVISMQDDPNGCDPHLETEVLSPYAELGPGEEYPFETRWQCCAFEGESVWSVSQCALVAKPVRVEHHGERLHATASFGVFQVGHLEWVTLFGDGAVGAVHPAGRADPQSFSVLDELLPQLPGASRVSLRIRDPRGNLLGTIGEAPLFEPAKE